MKITHCPTRVSLPKRVVSLKPILNDTPRTIAKPVCEVFMASIIDESSVKPIRCPYNPQQHLVSPDEFFLHLAQCRSRYYDEPGFRLLKCKYNGRHFIPAKEKDFHELICPSRSMYVAVEHMLERDPVPINPDPEPDDAETSKPSPVPAPAAATSLLDWDDDVPDLIDIGELIEPTRSLERIIPGLPAVANSPVVFVPIRTTAMPLNNDESLI